MCIRDRAYMEALFFPIKHLQKSRGHLICEAVLYSGQNGILLTLYEDGLLYLLLLGDLIILVQLVRILLLLIPGFKKFNVFHKH